MNKLIALALIVTALVACQKEEPERTDTTAMVSTAAPADAETTGDTSGTTAIEKTYTMNGKIVSRDAAKNEVTIDNEDVPGVMAPMAMGYELRGAKVDELSPDGSKITSTLHEQDGRYWVTDVKPVK